jgi:ADP-ribose pyrophosphatase
MIDKDKAGLSDRAVDLTLSAPTLIGRGFMSYERFDIAIARDDDEPLQQRRDILRASHVAALLPIDLARDEIVLIRQFRLPAHFATGRGEMVEIVAGRVDPGETARAAAARECVEEIGVIPTGLVELYSVLPTPGITDEYVTFFIGFVDASQVPERGGLVAETEDIRPFSVAIDKALAALEQGGIANALLVTALQWLAIHRERLPDYFQRSQTPGPPAGE